MEAKVPRAAVWKLKTQMCWWNSSSLSLNGWEPGKLSIVPGQTLAGLRSRKSLYFISILKGGKNNIPLLEGSHIRESSFLLWESEPFCYFQAKWLGQVHPHWGEWSALMIQILISSINTFTDIPWRMFDQMNTLRLSHSDIKLTTTHIFLKIIQNYWSTPCLHQPWIVNEKDPASWPQALASHIAINSPELPED